jgi:hypothetical protein
MEPNIAEDGDESSEVQESPAPETRFVSYSFMNWRCNRPGPLCLLKLEQSAQRNSVPVVFSSLRVDNAVLGVAAQIE